MQARIVLEVLPWERDYQKNSIFSKIAEIK
jgi:hypothetical protein